MYTHYIILTLVLVPVNMYTQRVLHSGNWYILFCPNNERIAIHRRKSVTRVIGLLEVGVDQSKWRQSMGRMEEQERTTRNSNSALGGGPLCLLCPGRVLRLFVPPQPRVQKYTTQAIYFGPFFFLKIQSVQECFMKQHLTSNKNELCISVLLCITQYVWQRVKLCNYAFNVPLQSESASENIQL